MKKFFSRFVYLSEDEKHPFLMFPFLLITLAYGIGFTFFLDSASVTSTTLYHLTPVSLGPYLMSIWGVAALVIVVAAFIGIYVRKAWLGNAVAFGGLALWIYVLIVYVSGGFWLQVFSLALPNILFWVWWGILIYRYHDK